MACFGAFWGDVVIVLAAKTTQTALNNFPEYIVSYEIHFMIIELIGQISQPYNEDGIQYDSRNFISAAPKYFTSANKFTNLITLNNLHTNKISPLP